MFRIIFVLDILNGQVVHAVKGEREKYKFIHTFSKVCTSSNPLDIVHDLAPREVYMADLNRLNRSGNNDKIIEQVGWTTQSMVDMGASTMDDVHVGQKLARSIILGTETASKSLLERATSFYPRSISMSIDILRGKVLTNDPFFKVPPIELIQILDSYDINDLIILELGKVGTSCGINRDFLEQVVAHSNHNILLGGGVRGMHDISLLKDIGLQGSLVATSIHNCAIPLDMIQH
jgi:phosphoribosylformimino-5-aminoimidazole carboxamide ribotide isomerase